MFWILWWSGWSLVLFSYPGLLITWVAVISCLFSSLPSSLLPSQYPFLPPSLLFHSFLFYFRDNCFLLFVLLLNNDCWQGEQRGFGGCLSFERHLRLLYPSSKDCILVVEGAVLDLVSSTAYILVLGWRLEYTEKGYYCIIIWVYIKLNLKIE